MAKYEATFSCGHTAKVTLFGPYAERERKLAWYAESGLCPECYKAKSPKGYIEIDAHGDDDWELRGDRCFDMKDEFKSRGFRWKADIRRWVWRGSRTDAAKKASELIAAGAAISETSESLADHLFAE